MDIKLKQRLIGAFVLLSAIGLFLIFLFHFAKPVSMGTKPLSVEHDSPTLMKVVNVDLEQNQPLTPASTQVAHSELVPPSGHGQTVPPAAAAQSHSKDTGAFTEPLSNKSESAMSSPQELSKMQQPNLKKELTGSHSPTLPQQTVIPQTPVGQKALKNTVLPQNEVPKKKPVLKKSSSSPALDNLVRQVEETTHLVMSGAYPARALSDGKTLAAPTAAKNIKVAQKNKTDKTFPFSQTLQIGSFANVANAERLVTRLRKNGFPVHVQRVQQGGQEMSRVYLNSNTPEQIQLWQDRLQQEFHLESVVLSGSHKHD